MMKYPLTVLIPTYGRPNLLERTLNSIVQCKLPDAYKELVVIENGSHAGAERLVAEVPERLNARYMHRERGNKSYALNEALDTIIDGLVVFFDDDVQVQPDTLIAYAGAAIKHGTGHYFGGTVRVDREEEPPGWLEPSLPDSARGYIADGRREDKYYLGFNWGAFASDIHGLGGFDPRFGPGASTAATGQETEMQDRMRAEGVKPVDVRDAVVTHHVPKERCSLRWAFHRRYRAGISGYYKRGGGAKMVRVAIRTYTTGALLVFKSVVIWKPKSIVFGLACICEALGVVHAYWKDWSHGAPTSATSVQAR